MRWPAGWCAVGLAAVAVVAHGGGRPEHIPAAEVDHSAQVSRRGAEVDVALPAHRGQELLEAVESGLSSRVSFELRLYRRRSGLMGIFGDQVLGEARVSHRASYAPLNDEYLLEVTRRHRGRDLPVAQSTVLARFDDRDRFRDALLSISDELVWPLQGDAAATDDVSIRFSGSEAYLSFRVLVQPVVLDPPLHIVSMFGRGSHATGWVNLQLRTPAPQP